LLSSYQVQIMILSGINVIMATSLNLITGFTGQLSIGHAAFMSIGAYASALATLLLGFPFYLSLVVGAVVASAFGVLLGLPTLKLKGDYLAIVTLGFGEIVRIVILNMDITGGAVGLRGLPKETDLLAVIICAFLTLLVLARILRSRVGRAFIAIREDETAAGGMGVNTTYYKVIAFGVGAFFAGLGGGLFSHYFQYIHPNSFGFMRSIEQLCMVVLGGLGNLWGSVVGAVALTAIPELLRASADYRQLFYGALLIIMMRVRPEGILGRRGTGTVLKKRLFNFNGWGKKGEA
jgi:branched-chain amino acid transport system permease protein